jgi:hypothetical protein
MLPEEEVLVLTQMAPLDLVELLVLVLGELVQMEVKLTQSAQMLQEEERIVHIQMEPLSLVEHQDHVVQLLDNVP